jgi:hypothetical protein
MAEDLSPQEKLFKGVRSENATISDAKDLKNDPANPAGKDPRKEASFNGLKKFFSKLGSGTKKDTGGRGARIITQGTTAAITFKGIEPLKHLLSVGFKPNVINNALIVALIGLTVAVVHYAVNKRYSMETMIEAISRIKFEVIEKKIIEGFKPVDYYLEGVNKRDIFNPFEEKREVKKEVPVVQAEVVEVTPRVPLKERAKNFKVVGVSWRQPPQVMVRDDSADATYFLKEGDKIGETDIEIKTILQDSVIISSGDEEMNLL